MILQDSKKLNRKQHYSHQNEWSPFSEDTKEDKGIHGQLWQMVAEYALKRQGSTAAGSQERRRSEFSAKRGIWLEFHKFVVLLKYRWGWRPAMASRHLKVSHRNENCLPEEVFLDC